MIVRAMGLNLLAVIAAAAVIWLIGFLLYAVLFSELWIEWMGWSPDETKSGASRMPFMVVMPALQAVGIALVIKWRDEPGWFDGLKVGLALAVFVAVAARMYGWVYSFERTELFGLDTLHLLLTHMAAGAILGAWK